MSPSEAIENLETYGRHLGNGFISINHDRSCELLLKNAVIVLEDARKCQSAQQLTTAQKIWHDGWQGQKAVVNSTDAALALSRQYGWA